MYNITDKLQDDNKLYRGSADFPCSSIDVLPQSLPKGEVPIPGLSELMASSLVSLSVQALSIISVRSCDRLGSISSVPVHR